MQEEILSGHFQNVDDLFTQAIYALREKNTILTAPVRPRQNLAQFLLESPLPDPILIWNGNRIMVARLICDRIFTRHQCTL